MVIERYKDQDMERIWDNKCYKYAMWREVESAIIQAQVELGNFPNKTVLELQHVSIDNKFVERVEELEQETRHDMIAFIKALEEHMQDSSYLHRGLTSSDVKDTANMVRIQESLGFLRAWMIHLQEQLGAYATRWADVYTLGRTHGMPAEPTTWGLRLHQWRMELKRHIKRLQDVRQRAGVGMFSGTVGTYTGLSLHAEKRACEILGLRPAEGTSQIISRDIHAEMIMVLAGLASSIEKWATEIRNLQRAEIGEVQEQFTKNQQGSSAMPHKKNPMKCERLCGLARLVRANVVPALENVATWHDRDLTQSSTERVIIPDSFHLVSYMLKQFINVLDHLKVNEERMFENLDKAGHVYSSRLLIYLMEQGLDRSEAYEIVQEATQGRGSMEGRIKSACGLRGIAIDFEEVCTIKGMLSAIQEVMRKEGS